MSPSDATRAIGERFGPLEQTCLIQRFGVGELLEPERFVKFAEACLLFGVPPSASWLGDLPAEWSK